MSTQETTVTRYATTNDIILAYHLLPPQSPPKTQPPPPPLVLLMHFRGNMDHWDPLLINTLTLIRLVLLLDNSGIGLSSGSVPPMISGWATHIVALTYLKISQVDLLGFFMDGGAAQNVALAAFGQVRKLILAGKWISHTPNTVFGPKHIFDELKNAVRV